jgi:hypothetical protein
MSRWALTEPRAQPSSFFSAITNPDAIGMLMPWAIGGAPMHTVVPPMRVAVMPSSARAAMPAASKA